MSLISSNPCGWREHGHRAARQRSLPAQREREILIDNLLVRVHIIIEMSRPALRHGSLNSLFQVALSTFQHSCWHPETCPTEEQQRISPVRSQYLFPHLMVGEEGYRCYSRMRTRTTLGPYARAITRSPGPLHGAVCGYTEGKLCDSSVRDVSFSKTMLSSTCREWACTCPMEPIKAIHAIALAAAATVSARGTHVFTVDLFSAGLQRAPARKMRHRTRRCVDGIHCAVEASSR